jgi:predicted glycosyltransferase
MSGGRFLFYTNECVGLGHFRRALTLARAVSELSSDASSLIVNGSEAAPSHPLPPRVDTVKLPLLARDEEGRHRARSLGVDLHDIRNVRSRLALAAAEGFRPDVTVVDKTPTGIAGELIPALEHLRAEGARVVLGLRDIEDEPGAVRRAWEAAKSREAIERFYDAVIVYGPRGPYDAISCMLWDDLPVPVHHVGFVGRPVPDGPPEDLPAEYVVVTAGGGADGYPLLSAFIESVRSEPLPLPALVVTGPLMAATDVMRLRAEAAGLAIAVEELRLDMEAVIAGARVAVAMAGYNTVSEIVRAGVPAMLVPRVRPSAEQLLRAQRIVASGRGEMLHPDDLTPAALRAGIVRLLDGPRPTRASWSHDGAARGAAILAELVEPPARPQRLAAEVV